MTVLTGVEIPTTFEGLLGLINDESRPIRLLAGGTDLLLKYGSSPGPEITMVDITRIPELHRIDDGPEGLVIGATVRIGELVKSPAVNLPFPVLAQAAGAVAGPQVRNLATIGGNLCNASPSADMVPALLVLDAQAMIASVNVRRSVPLTELFLGPGRVALDPGEILEGVRIPKPVKGAVASYFKLSPRKAMDLAVVGVAVSLWRDEAGLRARIGLGAVAPTPVRAYAAEDLVSGLTRFDTEVATEAGRLASSSISPISDVRASAGYRTKMVERLVTRLLLDLQERIP